MENTIKKLQHCYVVSKMDGVEGIHTFLTKSSETLGTGDGELGTVSRTMDMREARQFVDLHHATEIAEAINGKVWLVFKSDMYRRIMFDFEHP